MQGLLLVDKPSGWTSFDVVNYVRKMVAAAEGKKPKNTKVGHTGTLDPLATGLLVLLIGKECTKRAGEFSKLDKTYEVTAKLGETSTTGDSEGTITPFPRPGLGKLGEESLARGKVEEALRGFTGDISQTPPQYSAIKINGQRAYDLARKGKIAEIEARNVTIYSIQLTAYSYPDVSFVCDVSSGTYIRSLVEDIGAVLGTGAFTAQLRRTKVGKFDIKDANSCEQFSQENLANYLLAI